MIKRNETVERLRTLTSMFCDKYYPECSVRIMLDGTIGVVKEDKDSCILIAKLSVRDGELYKISNYDDFNWQCFIDFLME